MTVTSFEHTTMLRPVLNGDGAGFFAGGQFRVRIQLSSERDCEHYQYRQYIRGTATLQQGEFVGESRLENWRATGEPESVARLFAVPGGLRTSYTEDGERRNGQVHRFGYRRGRGVQEEGLEDRYLPHPNGAEYRLLDTWGLRGRERPVATRIRIRVHYKGKVIDTRRPTEALETQEWSYHLDNLFP